MMYRRIILLLCLIIGASLFCCRYMQNKNHFPKKTTVQFASWGSESEIKILKPLLNKFEQENPDIKIDFLHIPQNYFQKIHLLFASNTSPDVIFINNQYLPVYANAGVLEDLSDKDSHFSYDEFYPESLMALSWNGKIYAVPRDVSTLLIFYNKDIFDRYNVPYPKKNWTMDEFLRTAQKLTHRPDVFGISFEEEPLFYLPYLTVNGGGFESGVFENIESRSSLAFYAGLRNKYHVAPLKEESASATMAQMFLQEKLGMHLSGRWLVPKYREEAKFDWDVVEFPAGNNGSVVPLDASGWAISKSSRHKKEALMLIKYLSSEACSKEFTKSGLIVPARIDTAISKVFLDGQKPENAIAFLNIIKNAKPTPVSVDYREILDSVKSKTEYLFNKKQN